MTPTRQFLHARPTRWSLRRILAVAAAVALPIAAIPVALASATSGAQGYGPAEAIPYTVSFTTPGPATWVVPAGACNISVIALGGAGGYAQSPPNVSPGAGSAGGDGAEISMRNYPVKPGDTVSIVVGASAPDVTGVISGADKGSAAAGGGGATTINVDDPALRIVAGGGGGGAVFNVTGFQVVNGNSGGSGGGNRTNSHPSPDGAGQDADPGNPAQVGVPAKGGVGGVGGAGGTHVSAGMPGGAAGSSGIGGAGGAGVYGATGASTSPGGIGGGTGGDGGSGGALLVAGVGGAGGGGGGGYGGGGGGSGTGAGAGGGSVAPTGAKIYTGYNHSAGPLNPGTDGNVEFTYYTECGGGGGTGGPTVTPPSPQTVNGTTPVVIDVPPTITPGTSPINAGATCIVDPASGACGTRVTLPTQGTWVLDNAAGTLTFTALPTATPGATESVVLRVIDNAGATAEGTFSVLIPDGSARPNWAG